MQGKKKVLFSVKKEPFMRYYKHIINSSFEQAGSTDNEDIINEVFLQRDLPIDPREPGKKKTSV